MDRTRHLGICIVAVFAIIAGLGEIFVGFTGNYFGILSKNITPSFSTVVIGAFYSLGGLSLLTMKKWGAALGILFIGAEILGRVYLVTAGIAPSNGPDGIKIVIGGAIALAIIFVHMVTVEHVQINRTLESFDENRRCALRKSAGVD
jgi:hypothetical protein